MREDLTLSIYGAAGNNVTVNTAVATLPVPVPGRYKVWGMVRHTLADGCKLTSPVAQIITSGPNDTAMFGPFLVDINTAGNIIIALNTATGASDTASCTIYAEKLNH